MENPKVKDNVVKIGHNSNRSISQETLEKMANRFMHILEYVNNNLETLEKRYWEAFTKYPYRSKHDHYGRHKKLREHEVHEQKINADKQLKEISQNLYKEEDKLHEQLLEKFDINVMSKRQEWNKQCEEEDAKEGNND